MTEMPSISIRDKLVPGSHDTLIEVLGKYPRQAGNQVVLAMSEACLDLWPVTEADYNVAEEVEFQRVKITLQEDKYPKLYALYRSLPKGVKGVAIINLLNRHQMLRQVNPGLVTEALNKALALKQGGRMAVTTGGEIAEKKEPPAADVTLMVTREAGLAPRSLSETATEQVHKMVASDTPIMTQEVDDPLADLPPMNFA
ncbi:hypothetical protein [Pseudomonas violetae]|uniref:Uncharacterized protein n=1 Tax=Pseudomonas violetae TaxID=2915813 RepID=A0ABT0ET67_9PSED|nr:hypothetical protein [Pseudomonas violetae]MCK1788920.1 hypothetical protein [Pseudomonas violetae]